MKFLYLIAATLLTFQLPAIPNAITLLGMEQGLSNNYVVSITQDKEGFLWFATEEGLNRFDGSRFISYYKHNNNISGNELNCVYADPLEPVIWIGTQRAGLNAYNYEQNKLHVFVHNDTIPSSLITNDITDIKPAADGNLWISTYRTGVDYYDKTKNSFHHYNQTTLPGLPSDNVWTIFDDSDGHLFIGHVNHGMSVLSLKDKRIKNYRHDQSDPSSIPGNSVRCIYKDSYGNLWVGTDRGLALFNTNSGQFVRLTNVLDHLFSSYVFDIRQTDDNKLWVATELNGVLVIDLKQQFFLTENEINVQHYTLGDNKYTLSSPSVRCVFQDSFGNIWLGTYGGGINFMGHTPPLFHAYSYSPIPDDLYSMNNRVALSLCFDATDRLWVGTDGGGMNIFDYGKRVAVYNKEKGELSHNTIQAVYRDTNGNIWLGAFFGGINLYDAKSKQFRSVPINGNRDYDIRCFYEDNNQRIWVGTSQGIVVLHATTQQVIQHYMAGNNQLPEDQIRAIAQDNQGRMWIGTFGQGLAVYSADMRLLKEFKEWEGFCSNTINYIFNDSQGRMWVATGEGLVCFSCEDSFEYQVYTREDGLQNTFIRAVTEDKEGNIWFSTNACISCYLTDQGLFRNYTYFDKTPMGSFTNSVASDSQGMIYFGSINGVRYFDPVTVLSTREALPVRITEMRVFEARAAQQEDVTISYFDNNNQDVRLNYRQNTFSVTFNMQDYSQVNHIDYTYRLRGIEDTWYTVEENSVMFRNIPPGDYEFQVSTRVRNQEWSDDVSSLFIHITPPVWLSWWAKTMYALVAFLIIFALLYAYKKKVDFQSSYELEKKNHIQEQELNNERLRFYTNIAHELRTPLTLILGPLEDLQKDLKLQPKQQQKISVVRQSALRLLNLINQIMEFRKTETQNKKLCVSKDNLAAQVKEIGLKYKELNMKSDVSFYMYIEQENMSLYFDKEIVHIVLDNLISNAIKYTDKGKIILSLYTVEREGVSYTEMKVEDTGYGIPAGEQEKIFDRYYQAKTDRQASGTGIGLALVKNLVNLHEGEIRVESKLDEGSCFYFSLLTHNIYPNALHSDPEEKKEEEDSLPTADDPEDIHTNGKPILLIVEDNADIREYIAESFAESFEVVAAAEGEEGCKAAFTYIPDIIVSDIMMPGMNGITFCKKVKEDMRTSHIPVILLTAKDSLQDKEEGYVSGADSYLTKPFSASLLHSRINNLLETRRKLANQLGSTMVLNDKSSLLKDSLNQLDNEFIQHMTQLIEDNLESEKVDITYLSKKLFMSSSTLYRKVKALTGISTNEFVRKVKMKNAEQLLLTGKYNVSEIAFRVGMTSPVYFRQCFKEEFGITPSEYLRRIKKG